jgi:hypothetical protein
VSRFQAGGVSLKLLWYGFMLTAVLLAPLAVLLGQVLRRDGLAIVPTATVVGILAAVAQFVGLARWPFLVPTWREGTTIRHQPRRPARRPWLSSSRSTSTSVWRSVSASATSSRERGPCSLELRCSSRPRSTPGSPGPASRSASASSSAPSNSSPVRGEGLEACRHNRPDRLHCLVVPAGDLRARASHRITSIHRASSGSWASAVRPSRLSFAIQVRLGFQSRCQRRSAAVWHIGASDAFSARSAAQPRGSSAGSVQPPPVQTYRWHAEPAIASSRPPPSQGAQASRQSRRRCPLGLPAAGLVS